MRRPLFLLTLGLLGFVSAGCIYHGRGHHRPHRRHCPPPYHIDLDGPGVVLAPSLR